MQKRTYPNAYQKTSGASNYLIFYTIITYILMEAKDLDQIRIIIQNIDTQNKKVPYFTDLQAHPVYGQFFAHLDSEDIIQIQELISTYITDKIKWLKTKWWEMFRRFYSIHKEDFRTFRELNADINCVETDQFQTLGKKLEQELFKFEGILTQNMMKKPQGLDKTISAYYDIVYSFFPLYGQIK